MQQRILETQRFLDGRWILGQGTIYPDTIESGGTAKADLIKTHHNRVAGIQKLIDEGRIIEPLASFYKDEVRAIGRELGLAPALLDRHPFPGPGLAIRCLCASNRDAPLTAAGRLGLTGSLRGRAGRFANLSRRSGHRRFPNRAGRSRSPGESQRGSQSSGVGGMGFSTHFGNARPSGAPHAGSA